VSLWGLRTFLMTSNADFASSRVRGIPPDDSHVVLGVDRAFGEELEG